MHFFWCEVFLSQDKAHSTKMHSKTLRYLWASSEELKHREFIEISAQPPLHSQADGAFWEVLGSFTVSRHKAQFYRDNTSGEAGGNYLLQILPVPYEIFTKLHHCH